MKGYMGSYLGSDEDVAYFNDLDSRLRQKYYPSGKHAAKLRR